MIRRATLIDVPAMVLLAERMHQESRLSHRKFVTAKVDEVLSSLLDHARGIVLVAERNGEIIGGFIGVLEEHIFGDDLFAFDLATFILPQHRGGFTGPALIRAYVKWAQDAGAVDIHGGVASGINDDTSIAVFRRLGFVPTGLTMNYQGKR